MRYAVVRKPLTVGDGFRLGFGFMIAQLIFALIIVGVWLAGLAGLLVAAAATGG